MASTGKPPIDRAYLESARKFCAAFAADSVNSSLTSLLDVLVPLDSAIKVNTLDSAEHVRIKRDKERAEGKPDGEKKVEPLQITQHDDLLKNCLAGTFERLFLTGDGGTGKTELTRLIAYRMAKAFDVIGTSMVPCRVELKNYMTDGKAPPLQPSWTDLLRNYLAVDHFPWIEALADEGRVCFIFDGLDENSFAAGSFKIAITALITRFGKARFYFAGRPGSMLADLSNVQTHELQPLTYPLIQSFATSFFKAKYGKKDPELTRQKSQDFIQQLRANQSTLDPLIFTPFMVGFAIRLFDKRQPIPANPAELIEAGLIDFFDARRTGKELPLPDNESVLDALSIIAAHVQVPNWTVAMAQGKPLPGPAMSCSRDQAKRWLKQHLPKESQHELLEDKALDLLTHLVPASGVLFAAGTNVMFTNRVLTEFLAARWIARNGYPNWPYKDKPEGQWYISPKIVRGERERSLYDFLGDFAWSNCYRDLTQSVLFQLPRSSTSTHTSENLQPIVRTADWFSCVQLAFDGGRLFFPSLRVSGLLDAIEIVDRTAEDQAYDEIYSDLVLSMEQHAKDVLLPSLVTTCSDSEKDWVAIELLFHRIACVFVVENDLTRQAREFLLNALAQDFADPKENSQAFEFLRRNVASLFAEHNAAMRQARDELLKAMEAERTDPKENWRTIILLAEAIASLSFGDSEAMCHASDGLLRALEAACTKPMENYYKITSLSFAIVRLFAWDKDAMRAAKDGLLKALAAARTNPKEDSRAFILRDTVRNIATWFTRDGKALKAARDGLLEAMESARKDPWKNWRTIVDLSEAIASWFAGDKEGMKAARDGLLEAMEVARKDPEKNWDAIRILSSAIARWFARDKEGMKAASDGLLKVLKFACKKPKEDWAFINAVAEDIAVGFATEIGAITAAKDGLLEALAAQSSRSNLIEVLCGTIACRFTGDAKAAAAIIRAGNEQLLFYGEHWTSWVVFYGAEGDLKTYFVDSWLPSDVGTMEPIDEFVNLDSAETSRRMVLVAPREQIRRGLPAWVLEEIILSEQRKNLPPTMRIRVAGKSDDEKLYLDSDGEQSDVPVAVNDDQLAIFKLLSSKPIGVGVSAAGLLPSRGNQSSKAVYDALDPSRSRNPIVQQLISLVIKPRTWKKTGYRLSPQSWFPPHPVVP